MSALALHPTAQIHESAIIAETASVGAYSVIGPGVNIGDNCSIGPHVVIEGNTHLGENCQVHAFSVLGGEPQIQGGNTADGRLEIGADCIIREHVTIHRGSEDGRGFTRIRAGGSFMVGADIAPDCVVGEQCVFANRSTLGGHVVIGANVWLGGHSAVHQNCEVGRGAFIGGGAKQVSDVVPYGMTLGDRATLRGLNLRGMKRQGIPRASIHALRAAYQTLSDTKLAFNDRLEALERQSLDAPLVAEWVKFLKADRKRPLCLPEKANQP